MAAKVEPDRQTDKPTELKVWGVGWRAILFSKRLVSLYKVAAKVELDRQTDKTHRIKGLG